MPKRLYNWPPLKWSVYDCQSHFLLATLFFHCHLPAQLVFFQLICYILFYFLCIFSYCINIITYTPKFSISILVRIFAHLWYIIKLLFPSKIPLLMIQNTLVVFQSTYVYDLGMLLLLLLLFLSIHTIVSIFVLFLIFYLHKKHFLLYFGANTTWYLQFHWVCAKLFISFILICFIINVLLLILWLLPGSRNSYYIRRIFIFKAQR